MPVPPSPDQPDPDRYRADDPSLGLDPARAAVEMAEEDSAAVGGVTPDTVADRRRG